MFVYFDYLFRLSMGCNNNSSNPSYNNDLGLKEFVEEYFWNPLYFKWFILAFENYQNSNFWRFKKFEVLFS